MYYVSHHTHSTHIVWLKVAIIFSLTNILATVKGLLFLCLSFILSFSRYIYFLCSLVSKTRIFPNGIYNSQRLFLFFLLFFVIFKNYFWISKLIFRLLFHYVKVCSTDEAYTWPLRLSYCFYCSRHYNDDDNSHWIALKKIYITAFG